MLKIEHGYISILFQDFFSILQFIFNTFIEKFFQNRRLAYCIRLKSYATNNYSEFCEYEITDMRYSKLECTDNKSVFFNTFFNLWNSNL